VPISWLPFSQRQIAVGYAQVRAIQEEGSTSHSRTVLSLLADASVLPSGLNATLSNQFVRPCSGFPRGR